MAVPTAQQLPGDVHATLASALAASGPMPPGWGIDTFDHLVPFQWRARFSPVPALLKYSSTAQQFFFPVHAMPLLLTGRGLRGVTPADQRAPFQCSMLIPAVQQFRAPVQARPTALSPCRGVGTTDHRVPFQCMASFSPFLEPIIQQSLDEMHARPLRSPALRGMVTADQVAPFQCMTTVRWIPFAVIRPPVAQQSCRRGQLTAPSP